MKFIEIEELKIRKFQNLIKDVSSNDDSILEEIEAMAIDEITSYLRPRYDTEYIFSRTGSNRSPLIKRLVMDFMTCFLWERTNANEVSDSLVDRCEKNVQWLKDVAKGLISPDLPTKDPNLEQTSLFQGGSLPIFNDIDHID